MYIRRSLQAVTDRFGYRLVCPPPRLCTDNGVMIAWAGMEWLKEGRGIAEDPEAVEFQPRHTGVRNTLSQRTVCTAYPSHRMLLNTVLLLLSFVAYVTAQYETHSIGTCDLEPYILKLLTCDNHFFTAMRKDPDGDCGLRYKEAEFCYWKEIRECYVELYEGERLNSEVGSIMTQFPSEEAFCEGTGLGPIDFSEYHTNPCDSRKYRESISCVQQVTDQYCTLDLEDFAHAWVDVHMKIDHNPFCAEITSLGNRSHSCALLLLLALIALLFLL
uniref:N(6)-L-threonylcarbamoyladenine synthase n=1 Tax=Branchiostoma floridae TaxID=7739 RepID=C3YSK4_BRAFL|eukprot:XP_002600693.1 hypothetical protein BRAFLDRAFT_67758 [Branchiostoma floridae]